MGQRMKEQKETHEKGSLSIENLGEVATMDHRSVDFGIQIAKDGRVWICINGIAFLRFKPKMMPKNNTRDLSVTITQSRRSTRRGRKGILLTCIDDVGKEYRFWYNI